MRGFFRALDRRAGWQAAFLPGARIVHADGQSRTAAALARELAGAAPPRRRRLRRFTFGGGSALAWAGYENEAHFVGRTVLFRETAILERRAGAWKLARIHYSGGPLL